MDMIYLTLIMQVVVALGLLNVWLVRKGSQTKYRGGSAQNLREEFQSYGLPPWFFYLIGALKISAAIALLAGIWLPALVVPASILVAGLMAGALMMHLKVKDAALKYLPAACMFVMSGILALKL